MNNPTSHADASDAGAPRITTFLVPNAVLALLFMSDLIMLVILRVLVDGAVPMPRLPMNYALVKAVLCFAPLGLSLATRAAIRHENYDAAKKYSIAACCGMILLFIILLAFMAAMYFTM